VNLIVGENGQGKSNLIEAIHVLSSSKTFRRVQQRDLARWESEQYSVFGRVASENGDSPEKQITEIGVSYQDRVRKVFREGDVTRKVSEYLRIFPTVTFAPKDIDLIYGSPSVRRTLFDRYCSLISPKALGALTSYQKALRSKSALLRDRVLDSRQFQTLNLLIAEYAVILTSERSRFLTMVQPYMSEFYRHFAGSDGEVDIGIEESFLAFGAQERSVKEYERVLEACRVKESEKRGTLVGPHLDDFIFSLHERSARKFASQGQARSIVLALFLGIVRVIEERLGVLPALLLDDFSSELDQGRMGRFFELIRSESQQVFITGTDLPTNALSDEECSVFQVKSGQIITPHGESDKKGGFALP
jgi:DNA replication and repair protein RecF